jgi:hypothetical protein
MAGTLQPRVLAGNYIRVSTAERNPLHGPAHGGCWLALPRLLWDASAHYHRPLSQ